MCTVKRKAGLRHKIRVSRKKGASGREGMVREVVRENRKGR